MAFSDKQYIAIRLFLLKDKLLGKVEIDERNDMRNGIVLSGQTQTRSRHIKTTYIWRV